MLPQVLTPELPRDPSLWSALLETLPELQTIEITDADRTRHEQYRSRRLRQQERAATASLDDYLRSLAISVAIRPVDHSTLARVHQLFERTNQFNLTTRRHGTGELEVWMASDDALL